MALLGCPEGGGQEDQEGVRTGPGGGQDGTSKKPLGSSFALPPQKGQFALILPIPDSKIPQQEMSLAFSIPCVAVWPRGKRGPHVRISGASSVSPQGAQLRTSTEGVLDTRLKSKRADRWAV